MIIWPGEEQTILGWLVSSEKGGGGVVVESACETGRQRGKRGKGKGDGDGDGDIYFNSFVFFNLKSDK